VSIPAQRTTFDPKDDNDQALLATYKPLGGRVRQGVLNRGADRRAASGCHGQWNANERDARLCDRMDAD
jgi:hypothetical protein